MPANVAVVAAHPDDEILGCGGTMSRLARDGAEINVLILAEGLTSRDEQRDPDHRSAELAGLRQAAQVANRRLGVRSVSFGGFADNRMDSLALLDVVKVVERFLVERQAAIVITHHCGDLNVDHRIVHEAVVTACRPMPGASTRTLLFFEVPSSTEWQPPGSGSAFTPSWFEDIANTLPDKIAALRDYDAEMRPWPHARSYEAVEALARWRGASVGLRAAEAFMIGRHIVGEERR